MSKQNVISTLGERIRTARHAQNLTQEALAGPEFTKGYVSALERGAVRPSLKALDVFARRLNKPISEFLEVMPRAGSVIDLEVAALEEDLHYQFNYARMLIRSGEVGEAFRLIGEAEESAQPYRKKLSGQRVLYRIPFLRGLAHIRGSDPKSAQPELRSALELLNGMGDAGPGHISSSGSADLSAISAKGATGVDSPDGAAEAQVRNMLGVSYYLTEQPQLALEQHLRCLHSVESGAVKDLSLRLSIYRNLANDYWALNDLPQAIGVYRKALPLVEDLDDLEREAGIYWGLAMTYKAAGEWPHAKLYAMRALHTFEATNDRAAAATISLDLAEILMGEGRYEEGEEILSRAGKLIEGTGNNVLQGNLLYDYADLARRRGQLQKASGLIAESLTLLEASVRRAFHSEGVEGSAGAGGDAVAAAGSDINAVRTYSDALHVAALIEDAKGDASESDRLYKEAIRWAEESGFTERIHTISLSYGEALAKRGAFQEATEYMRVAALARLRPPRMGN